MTLKVKVSPELFERWQELEREGEEIAAEVRFFSSIVQNDMLITEEQLQDWKDRFVAWRRESMAAFQKWREKGLELFNETHQYVISCNVPD